MTDEEEAVIAEAQPRPAAPAPTRAKRRKQHRRKVARTEKPEFPELTEHDCPRGCVTQRCVITGTSACGHPAKAGAAHLPPGDRAALARFERAKAILAHRQVERSKVA